jgi:hypothetical protein
MKKQGSEHSLVQGTRGRTNYFTQNSLACFAENNVGVGNTSSDAVHEPLSSAQVVEGFAVVNARPTSTRHTQKSFRPTRGYDREGAGLRSQPPLFALGEHAEPIARSSSSRCPTDQDIISVSGITLFTVWI